MPRARKKSAAEKQLEQSKRFKEAAKKIGRDETGKDFERIFEKVVPANKRELDRNK